MHSINTSSADSGNNNNKRSGENKVFLKRVILGYQSLERRYYSSAVYRLLSYINTKMSSIGRFRHTIAEN